MEWPKPVDEFASDGPITRSLRASAGEEISLDECVPTGYDLNDSEGVVGRLEEPRAGRPALACAHDGVWLIQPVGHRWDMAAQDPVSGEVAAYYRGALLRAGGTVELANEREFGLRRDWLRPSRWRIADRSGVPLARMCSRPGGRLLSVAHLHRTRPRKGRIEVSLTADASKEDQLGILVLFACYVILVVETVRGYLPHHGG